MITEVDSIFLTTSFVKRYSGNSTKGTATGFFYTKDNKAWFVTNKHVLYGDGHVDDKAQLEIDNITLVLHTQKTDLSKNEEVNIKLVGKEGDIWKEHKDKQVDIVCIPLQLDRAKYHFITVADDVIDTTNIKIGFEKIFVMGYPFGWYDDKFNLPITRIGHLSSPYGVPFKGMPFMLGDVETHKGMSGSPVFMYLKDYMTKDENGNLATNLGASRIILLGVYSGQPSWPVIDSITNNTINIPHSLSLIWFSTLIREIVG